jgi:hypothetical protein
MEIGAEEFQASASCGSSPGGAGSEFFPDFFGFSAFFDGLLILQV